MNIKLTAIFMGVLVFAHANGQQEPTKVPVIAMQDSAEMALRVLQYEILLGTELNPLVAVCIDQTHRSSWILPESSSTEASAKAIERIRRTAEICRARTRQQPSDGPSVDMRLATDIRTSLEFQLNAARALEVTKRSAQNCISQSKTDETFKTCISTALPNSSIDALWAKWLSVFGRRISIAANAPTGN